MIITGSSPSTLCAHVRVRRPAGVSTAAHAPQAQAPRRPDQGDELSVQDAIKRKSLMRRMTIQHRVVEEDPGK